MVESMDIVGFMTELILAQSANGRTGKDDPKKPEKTGGKPGDSEIIDVDKPLWDQETYLGRWRHFAFITDVRTVIVPTQKLHEANQLLENYK